MRERAGRYRTRRFKPSHRAVCLHARIPPERVCQWKPRIRRGVADRKARKPAAAAHPKQIIGTRRQRVGPERRQVLISQRVADEQIIGGVGVPRKGAEGPGNPANLDIEVPVRKRMDPDVYAVGPRSRVLEPHVGERRDVVVDPDRGRDSETGHPQRGMVVVAVVEEAGVAGAAGVAVFRMRAARGERHVAADDRTSVGEHDRLRREDLRAERMRDAHQRRGDG